MVAYMRIIKLMCGYARMDRIRNKEIRDIVKVAPTKDKKRKIRLRWFGDIKRRSVDASLRRCERINILEGKRGRGRPKKSLDEVIKEDLEVAGLTEDIAHDRRLWWDRTRILDHRELAN